MAAILYYSTKMYWPSYVIVLKIADTIVHSTGMLIGFVGSNIPALH